MNTLSAGDKVLMYETGHFATRWQHMAEQLGVVPRFMGGSWRHGMATRSAV